MSGSTRTNSTTQPGSPCAVPIFNFEAVAAGRDFAVQVGSVIAKSCQPGDVLNAVQSKTPLRDPNLGCLPVGMWKPGQPLAGRHKAAPKPPLQRQDVLLMPAQFMGSCALYY